LSKPDRSSDSLKEEEESVGGTLSGVIVLQKLTKKINELLRHFCPSHKFAIMAKTGPFLHFFNVPRPKQGGRRYL